jgi:hypothetical protein
MSSYSSDARAALYEVFKASQTTGSSSSPSSSASSPSPNSKAKRGRKKKKGQKVRKERPSTCPVKFGYEGGRTIYSEPREPTKPTFARVDPVLTMLENIGREDRVEQFMALYAELHAARNSTMGEDFLGIGEEFIGYSTEALNSDAIGPDLPNIPIIGERYEEYLAMKDNREEAWKTFESYMETGYFEEMY